MEALALVVTSGRVLPEAPKPMREQQVPLRPELHQQLLFASSELLACGLTSQALSVHLHRRPHGGRRAVSGARRRRRRGRIPGRVGTHGHQLDCSNRSRGACEFEGESRNSQRVFGRGRLRLSAEAQRCERSARRRGIMHLGWNLRTPVHRGAASATLRPLAALGRIAEYYAVTLRSDRGYVGVLAYNRPSTERLQRPFIRALSPTIWHELASRSPRPTGDGQTRAGGPGIVHTFV